MTMLTDPQNLLAPPPGLMVATLTVLLIALGLVIYLLRRLVGAVKNRAAVPAGTPSAAELQEQVNQLASRVHELDESQRFFEQVLSKRPNE